MFVFSQHCILKSQIRFKFKSILFYQDSLTDLRTDGLEALISKCTYPCHKVWHNVSLEVCLCLTSYLFVYLIQQFLQLSCYTLSLEHLELKAAKFTGVIIISKYNTFVLDTSFSVLLNVTCYHSQAVIAVAKIISFIKEPILV